MRHRDQIADIAALALNLLIYRFELVGLIGIIRIELRKIIKAVFDILESIIERTLQYVPIYR